MTNSSIRSSWDFGSIHTLPPTIQSMAEVVYPAQGGASAVFLMEGEKDEIHIDMLSIAEEDSIPRPSLTTKTAARPTVPHSYSSPPLTIVKHIPTPDTKKPKISRTSSHSSSSESQSDSAESSKAGTVPSSETSASSGGKSWRSTLGKTSRLLGRSSKS